MRVAYASHRARPTPKLLLVIMFALTFHQTANAAGCHFEQQGEGRVSEIIDGRTLRLHDGREVVLAGIEIAAVAGKATADMALASLVADRDVTLAGESDMPDRYGRQPAFVFIAQGDRPVQHALLAQGVVVASSTIVDKGCAGDLAAAERDARLAKRGVWAQATAIKNAESPGDILAAVGQFTLVEGRVLSVREAGTTTYVNFGRRWTQDFAVTISRRMMAVFDAAGISPKSFERRRILVRGFVERHGGPRIEVIRLGQIEVVGDN
jgi:endonuclease YncB( thermonuclease family)